MKNIKGGSPFTECESRDCKIRSLSMSSISCMRSHFLLHLHHWKKVQLTWTFFQLLESDDIKVNITQKMSTKIHPELDSLCGFWWKLQNLLWNYVKQKKKIMLWKTCVLFQMREAVGPSEVFQNRCSENSGNFPGKILCWCHFLIKLQGWKSLQLYQKETPAWMFSCEICKFFKNTFF